MQPFVTVNPMNGKVLREYQQTTNHELDRRLERSVQVFHEWRRQPLAARLLRLEALSDRLRAQTPTLATLATEEMGKPITQSQKELEKCLTAIRYYVDNSPKILANQSIPEAPLKTYVKCDPLGPILCIMPWNFPYWQVLRFAVPALAAGNTVLLKHADITTGTALKMEELFLEAGFPEGLLQTLIVDHQRLAGAIRDPRVRGVTLTGSERAGREVGRLAGESLKPSVLELGGSDAYLVLDDADLDLAVDACVTARFVNSGQSCVAGKRFIVHHNLAQPFKDAFVVKAKQQVIGDPMDHRTTIGPLAKTAIRDELAAQIQRSRQMGAELLYQSSIPTDVGFYAPISVLANVKPGMPAFDDEVFGPAAAIVEARDDGEAIRLANQSRFGLGGAVFSRQIARAEAVALQLDCGMVAINTFVQSDTRVPFGGTKCSGHGRELGAAGMHEFVSLRSVTVNSL